MKPIFQFVALLAFLAIAPSMYADVTYHGIQPGRCERAGFLFESTAKRFADGSIHFHIVVSPQTARFSQPDTDLSNFEWGDIGQPLHRVRALPYEQKDGRVVCDFIVPEQSLEEPKLCFAFANGVEQKKNGEAVEILSGDFFDVHLSSFKDHLTL